MSPYDCESMIVAWSKTWPIAADRMLPLTGKSQPTSPSTLQVSCDGVCACARIGRTTRASAARAHIEPRNLMKQPPAFRRRTLHDSCNARGRRLPDRHAKHGYGVRREGVAHDGTT